MTRRVLLGGLSAACFASRGAGQKTQPLPQAGEFVRFADPETETPVVRLTSPAYLDVLPATYNRSVCLKPRFLVCASNRGGGMSPYEVDLRTGAVRQIVETESLDPHSLSLDPQGRSLFYLDGGSLFEATTAKRGKRPDRVAEGVSAFGIGATRADLYTVKNGRLLLSRNRTEIPLAEDAAGPCIVRPGGQGCLFTKPLGEGKQAFWYADAGAKPRLVAQGDVSYPCWAADGRSIFFLRKVREGSINLSELFEAQLDDAGERCVTRTSQFATLAANGDSSVFVGASASKAQPNIVILLRSPQRELTLCEHRASDPAEVKPVFSPDSRRVYFQSDREGRPALYSVNVEQLIEPTQENT